MTWSIIAKDTATGRIGIIVATKFFAVGSRVPHIRTGVGAVASQAFVNPYFGQRGLDLLASGAAADHVIRALIADDEGRAQRQLHMLDQSENFAAYTGTSCISWCGHAIHDGFSIAGNMLAGEAVIADTARAYQETAELPFARRLIAAMRAGEVAGGDMRGKQSAALLIHDDEDYSLLDLRVDDHADPLAELTRLEEVARERWLHFRRLMPSRDRPSGITDRSTLELQIARSIAEGYE